LLVETLNQIFGNLSFSSRLVVVPLCIFGSVLLKNCLVYGNTVLFSWLNWQISDRLRRGIYKQLLSVSFGYLERNQSGRFLSILDKETWQTSQALSVFISLITSACTIVVFVILLFLISWQLTVLVAVAMLLISWSVQSVTRQVKSVGKQAARANAAFVSRALEGLSGMKVIRAFGRESYEQERFEQASQEVCTTFRRLDVISGAVNPFSEVLSTALLTGILIVALQDQSNLPTLLTFIFMLYRLQPQMKLFDSARVNLGGLTGSVEQVMELLNRADKTYIFSGQSFGQNRTVIVIAHRLSTIEQADQIIVMEKGRVREKGSIQSLLQLNGLFAQLYHLQHNTVLT